MRGSLPALRSLLALIAALAALAVLVESSAAAEMHHAAVIARHGDGGISYSYVAFPEDKINAAELLQRANLGAVTIEFGGLGEAVCIIENEGCPPSVCQKRVCQTGATDSPFWHFFKLDAAGAWQMAALGASSVSVRDGDVTGWSWTSKDANLPATSFVELKSAAAGKTSADGTALVWRSGPARAPHSRQSWPVYAGAAVVLLIAVGAAGFIAMRKRRPIAPGSMGNE